MAVTSEGYFKLTSHTILKQEMPVYCDGSLKQVFFMLLLLQLHRLSSINRLEQIRSCATKEQKSKGFKKHLTLLSWNNPILNM